MKCRESKIHTVREINKQSNPKGKGENAEHVRKLRKQSFNKHLKAENLIENPKGKSTTVLFKKEKQNT